MDGIHMNNTRVIPRYPFQPLAVVLGMTEYQAARHLGISGSTEQQYRREGMTLAVADRLAIRSGHHPYELWPEMVDDVIEQQRSYWRATKSRQRAGGAL